MTDSSDLRRVNWRRPRILYWAGLGVAAMLAFGIGAGFLWDRATGKHSRGRRAWLEDVAPEDIARCNCQPDQDVEIRRPDGLRLAGSIDRPAQHARHPAIILLHGNTPDGRRLPTYRVLARFLRDQGFVVLSIDFAGMRQSEDPFLFGTPEALDSTLDVHAALAFLRGAPEVDPSSIHIICHSMGCRSAFSVGLVDPLIGKIVALGPPRGEEARHSDDDEIAYFWARARKTHRQIYGREFPEWYTREMWLKAVRQQTMQRHMPLLAKPGHKPVLFMDGELESRTARRYLRDYVKHVADPKRYVTIPGSNHYINTVREGGMNLYDRRVMNRTTAEIVRWLRPGPGADSAAIVSRP